MLQIITDRARKMSQNSNQLVNIIEKIKNTRLPSICILCNQYHHEKQTICSECQKFLIKINNPCSSCASQLLNVYEKICNSCQIKKPYVDEVFTAYLYEEPLKTLLHDFKYKKCLYIAPLLTKLMLDVQINKEKIKYLLPIPIHPQKLRERGFNQAAILTINLAKKLNLPYDLTICKKIINTPSQASLKASDRKQNLKNAFKAQAIKHKEITLVDDLLTTGNTANEIAKTLKKLGATKVNLWCCARANLANNNNSKLK